MEALFIFVWLILPIVLGPLCIHKNKKIKELKLEQERIEKLLEAYREQNRGLQSELLKARRNGGTPVAEAVATAPVEETKAVVPMPEAEAVAPIEPVSVPKRLLKAPSQGKERKITSGMVMFGVGIVLILVAGTIFATTTWQILPAFAKVAVLLAAVAVFYASAWVAQKKLDLRETSIAFYILGSCFFAVINLAIGYFEWFGLLYSISSGGELVWGISIAIAAACFYVGGKLYDTKVMTLIGYYCTLIAAVVITGHLTDEVSVQMVTAGICLALSFVYVYFVEVKEQDVFIGKSTGWLIYAYSVVVLALNFFDDSRNLASFYIVSVIAMALVVAWAILVINDEVETGSKIHKVMYCIAGVAAVMSFGFAFHGISKAVYQCMISLAMLTVIYGVWNFVGKRIKDVPEVAMAVCIATEVMLFLTEMAGIDIISDERNGIVIVMLVMSLVIGVIHYFDRGNISAIVSTTIVYYSLSETIYNFLEDGSYNVLMVIYAVLFVVALVLGRVLFRKAFDRGEDEKGWFIRIDWASCASFIFILAFLATADISIMDKAVFWGVLMFALYAAAFWKRVPDIIGRLFLTAGLIITTLDIITIPYLDIPSKFFTEWTILITLLATAVGSLIWMNAKRLYEFVWVVIIVGCYIGELITISDNTGMENAILFNYKVVLYLAGTIGLFVVGYLRKNRKFIVVTGVALAMIAWMADSTDAKGLFILAGIIGMAYLAYLYFAEMEVWAFLPLLQVLILLSAFDVKKVVWIAVYVVFIVTGILISQRKEYNETRLIHAEWFNVLAIVPVLEIITMIDERWEFVGKIMLAILVLSFYKRINVKRESLANKMILTISSFIILTAWISQPFVSVSRGLQTEWCIVGLMLFAWGNMILVYRDQTDETWGWITFAISVACILWQASDALAGENVGDVLILGSVMVLGLVLSYIFKKKQWFILSAITLVLLAIYATRAFWLILAWWVYLLVAGAILIVVAATSEYKKRSGVSSEKNHWFDEWTL